MSDLDKQAEEYFNKNPMGNHIEPSPETLRFFDNQKEINEHLREGQDEIKTTMSGVLVELKGIHEQTKKTNGNIIRHRERIGKLENWRWYLVGGGSVVLFVFTLAVSVLK